MPCCTISFCDGYTLLLLAVSMTCMSFSNSKTSCVSLFCHFVAYVCMYVLVVLVDGLLDRISSTLSIFVSFPLHS